MTVSGSFNLTQATNSQSYAYKCWYNYNYGGNTMGISAKDMGEITQTWNTELTKWRTTAQNVKDENKYEISDDDFNASKLNAKNEIKDETGYNGKKGGMATRAAVDVGASAFGAAVGSTAWGNGLGQSVAQIGKSTCNATGKTSASFVIAAPLSLAVATTYMVKKPNKDAKEACDELQNSMNDAQVALTSAQGDMEDYAGEIEELSDEAATQNEDANDSIEEDKTEFDMYRASYEALMEKVNSGETLTEDERNLLNELVPLMQELGVNINETQEDTTDTVGTLYDEMGTYQDGYDEAAGTMAEVQGVTDYAESFDSATRTMCYVEAAAQGLNAASGTQAAIKATSVATSGSWAFGATSWAWAFAAMGYAGAAMSGIGVAQQIKWAGEVGTEIDLRKQAQDLNVDTQAVYDENIDVYAGQMEGVEDLELEIPDDIEAPEEAPEIPTDSGATTTASTSKDNPFGQATTQGVNDNSNNNGINANNADKDKEKDKNV